MNRPKPDTDLNLSAPVEVQEPWATAFKNAGLVSPVTDEPSIQALHRESDVHPSAIARILSGRTRNPRMDTIEKLAKGLGVSPIEVAGWIGKQWDEYVPWNPPAEANLMTARQRELIESLIREVVSK